MVEHDPSERRNLLLVGLGQEAGNGLSSVSSAGARVLVAYAKALLPGLLPSAERIVLLNSSGGAFFANKELMIRVENTLNSF